MTPLGPFVLTPIAFIIQLYAKNYMEEDLSSTLTELEPDLSLPRIRTYDFIVVGAGTAGCLVAGRLSERFSVLLLENGGNPPPASYNTLINHPGVSDAPEINNLWTFLPQNNGFLENGVGSVPLGRMLGGSGSHNDNLYSRGSPHDWDSYAQLTGDPSWRYESMIQHFKKVENFVGTLITERDRAAYYGVGGPITVTTMTPAVLPAWFQAAQELGYPIDDVNAYQRECFAPLTLSTQNSERSSTYTGYIKNIETTRKSLRVLRYSKVNEVLISDNNVAYGVTYLRHGIPQIAHATREVIISAGTFQSPLLLFKSGIGPRNVLEPAKISLKWEVPGVGQNLKDHLGINLSFAPTARNATLFYIPKLEDSQFQEALNQFQQNLRSGFLTDAGVGPQAFIASSRAKAEGQGAWPDYQIVAAVDKLIGSGLPGISASMCVTRAKASGSVGLNSTAFLSGERDDTRLALIDHPGWKDPSDIAVTIEGIRLTFKIFMETSAFGAMGIKHIDSIPQRCVSFPLYSDAYWACYAQSRGSSTAHFGGTCRMGRQDDPWAVVDSKLRVRGISRLRVIDASVLPNPANGSPNAHIIGLAEKAVSDILAEHSSQYPNNYESS